MTTVSGHSAGEYGPGINAPLISIVSPVHNEGEGVRAFVDRTTAVLESEGENFEIVLIDDGSRDDSWQHIIAAHQADARVRGISLSRNFGKDPAMLAGLSSARGHAVVIIDSDLQHPPEVLPSMLEAWRRGADVVEAVKRTRSGQSVAGKLASRAFNHVFDRLTGVDLTDATDYRLLSRRAVSSLLTLPERTFFFRGTSSWIGFKRTRIEFDVAPREAGASRWRFRTLFRYAINAITSFTASPLHLVTFGALLFGAFSVVLGLQTLIRFVQGSAVTGFTTVILILLIQGTLILSGLGIIGEYLARIHDEVKNRPRYLVGATTDPTQQVEPVVAPEQDLPRPGTEL
ncbi:glycosyltransferase family 2 protein [Georgenia sp. Marseille-Q6866]